MNIEEFRDYCLTLPFVTEELPFGPDTLVYKVGGKIFALTGLDSDDFRINLKNTPEKNEELRAEHDFILPGFHMNKKHWNTVIVDFRMTKQLFLSLINESYQLVYDGLSKKEKEKLVNL